MKPGRILIELGAERCSDVELLAILLGSGGRGYSALDSANALLDKYGTLAGLMDRPLDEVAKIRGVKAVRAIRLAAAYEACQRLLEEVARIQRTEHCMKIEFTENIDLALRKRLTGRVIKRRRFEPNDVQYAEFLGEDSDLETIDLQFEDGLFAIKVPRFAVSVNN